jgi:hypothetical protein
LKPIVGALILGFIIQLLMQSRNRGLKKGDDEFAQKWQGKLGWPASNKQTTKFAANFQLFVSLIDLGIYLSFLG